MTAHHLGRPPIGKLAMTGAERQRRYLARLLRDAKPTADTAKLEARIRELEALLVREQKRPAPKAAEPKPPPDDPDSQVARLKKANRLLRAKVTGTLRWHEAEMRRAGKMPLGTYRAVVKCLHPDTAADVTQKERTEAYDLFTQWKQSQDRRR